MSAVIVVGAGPGVSGSLARLYAAEGWSVGLVGNDEAALADLAASLHGVRVERRVADVADPVTGGQAVEDLAPHVRLELIRRGVADPHRSRNLVALQPGQLLLG